MKGENMNGYNQKQSISCREAIDLLFLTHDTEGIRSTVKDARDSDYFDKYGNYSFPTDYVIDSPNQAYGMAGIM